MRGTKATDGYAYHREDMHLCAHAHVCVHGYPAERTDGPGRVGRGWARPGRGGSGLHLWMALALVLAMAAGCGGGGEAPGTVSGEAPAGAPGGGPGAAGRKAAEPGALATVLAEPVHGWTGPGGQPFEVARRTPEYAAHLQRRIGVASFDIALRKTGLTQFPCSSCHPPGVPPTATPDRIADAHRNIQPDHPAATGARCRTCHAVDVNMERLTLQSGELATLDQAYRLCSQCHYLQAEAWAGGAHGKRLDGWQGRRVVMNCTDCHDPHRPHLEKRVPFPGPRIPRTTPHEP